MKIGFQFKLNGNNCIICDIKEFENQTYANICIENNKKVDYKIVKITKGNDNNFNIQEVKDENLLSKIMPLFVFDNVTKKKENEVSVIDKYLPLGTVVLLKNAYKRIMITGFACSSPENEGQIYDYCGCLYPEGIISSNQNMLFFQIIFHPYY